MADETDSPTPEVIQMSPPAPAQVRSRASGTVWLVLGGVVAAGLGFGVSRLVPGGWPLTDTSALGSQVQALVADNAALKSRLNDLAEHPVPDPALLDRISALEARPAATKTSTETSAETSAELAALTAQVQALANTAGVSTDAAAFKALQDQVAALSSAPSAAIDTAIATAVSQAVKTAQVQLDATVASAEASAAALTTDAALTRIAAALDGGAPYASALADLGQLVIPPVLADHAATGLPTLQSLRETFPDAARAALEAAREADMGASWTDRITSFLQTQTGARSLTPRAGNDPDSILSRAEAALDSGDVAATLAELATLPQSAKPALAAWQALAQQRLDAAVALSDLAKAGG